jgi:hypothetical protein
MDIRASTPNHIKIKMRKTKTLPACIKAALLKGCKSQGAYIQFHTDLATFGLWEAMLFVEDYEKSGDYAEGTAHNAMDAYFKTPTVAKILKAALG